MATDDEFTTWIEVDMLNNPFDGISGVVIPRITGLLSILSSALIIKIILHSTIRLSSTYHRIMMAMSIYDIIGTAAMALTTLPLPKDDEWVNLYNFDGTRLGTYETCTAQGFLHIFGTSGAFSYNMVLGIYYACSVALSMEAKKIKRCVEPWLHLSSIVISVSISLQILLREGYNPAPRRTSWCTMSPLPYSCLHISSLACKRGSKKHHYKMETILNTITLVVIIVNICCLSAVCVKVTKLYIEIKKSRRGNDEMIRADLYAFFRNMRATYIQAISYMLALLITMTPNLVINMMASQSENTKYRLLTAVTVYLQGTFNFVIFVGAKIHQLRRADSEVSFKDALREVMLRAPLANDDELMVFTGMPIAVGFRSSRLPSDLGRPIEEELDYCSNNRISMNESLDMSLSIGAWVDTSTLQSEIRSRRIQSDGTPEDLSKDFSCDLSLPTKRKDKQSNGLSTAS